MTLYAVCGECGGLVKVEHACDLRAVDEFLEERTERDAEMEAEDDGELGA